MEPASTDYGDFCSECGAYWSCDCGEYSRRDESLRHMRHVNNDETYANVYGRDIAYQPITWKWDDLSDDYKIAHKAYQLSCQYGLDYEEVNITIRRFMQSFVHLGDELEKLREACIQFEKQLQDIQRHSEEKRAYLIGRWVYPIDLPMGKSASFNFQSIFPPTYIRSPPD